MPVSEPQRRCQVQPVLNFKMTSLDGKVVDLAKYQGKVVLFVNVACECGFTPQYKTLQASARKIHQGEPSSACRAGRVRATFCKKNYGVTFDMLGQVVVGKAPPTSF